MSGTDINRASGAARDMADKASSTASDLAGKASATMHDMADMATEKASEIGSKAKEYGQGIHQQIEQQPVTSVVIAAAAAFVAGIVTACLASGGSRTNGRG